MVEESFHLGGPQRAGMALVMEIDELANPVLVAILGTRAVMAATADDGYKIHQAGGRVNP